MANKILNEITFYVESAELGRIEQKAQIIRPYRLTAQGALRVLRSEGYKAVAVAGVSAIRDER